MADLARSLGVKRGDEVKLLTRLGLRRVRVAGLLASQGAAAFQGGAIVFMPLDRRSAGSAPRSRSTPSIWSWRRE